MLVAVFVNMPRAVFLFDHGGHLIEFCLAKIGNVVSDSSAKAKGIG